MWPTTCVPNSATLPLNSLTHSSCLSPCAAAQVYFARVRATGQAVAVKVQRPGALSTISKDLYVMRRGVGVYEQLVKRFTAQTTDYQQLLSTFAEGLYTEMDFRNEVRVVCGVAGDKEGVGSTVRAACCADSYILLQARHQGLHPRLQPPL